MKSISSSITSSFPRSSSALCALACAHSLCADDIGHQHAVELERVVITARPSERPLSVTTDPRAPAQPIPAQDGAEALRGIAGMNVIRKGGTDGDPVLRGMAGSRLGILLDGENILGGCGSRMDPPTAYVFPASYDRITVLKGPQSVLHGSGNSAGVVLFERNPPRYSEPSSKTTGALTFGSYGRNDQFLEIRAGKPRVYGEVAGTRTASDDYRDGDGRSVASAYERWSGRAALGWTPSADTVIELSSIASDGEAAYADRAMDGSKFARRNLSLRIRTNAAAEAIDSIEANLFYNGVDHVMDNYSIRSFGPTPMMPGKAASNPDRQTIGGRMLARMSPDRAGVWKLASGADFQANRHRIRSTGDEAADPYESKVRVKDAAFSVLGVFTEATRIIAESQRIVSGVRLDAWRATDHRMTVATGMMGSAMNPTAAHTRAARLPSYFLRYENEWRPGFSAFAGLGHTRRFPDYWELFSKESADSVSAFASRPELTTQFDAGITHRSRLVQASFTVFANRIEDYILIESAFSKSMGMMTNRRTTITRNVDARSLGAESSLSWIFAEGWTVDASVSIVRGDNRTDDRPLAQQPPPEGRLGVSYATSTWSIGSLVRSVARQNRFAINQGSIVGQDLGPSPGFTTLSLNGAWKPSAHWQLSAGVDNILDRTYAEHLSRGGTLVPGFPPPTIRVNEPGRTLWAKLDCKW
ncbi:MAG: TonB-dependent copper receptor [Opitutaceae bacterium]|nr:TonB-dependent copper receptor [Opitutaceae bacterium]